MRLGSYKCSLEKGTQIYNSYKSSEIHERHRHRYDFNNKYQREFNDHGMKYHLGWSKLNLIETIELDFHPWFIGTQYHPEYRSRVLEPHPLIIICK